MKSMLTILLCCTALPLHAQEDAVLPYRPSVSSPAQLPVPGQLEFETGVLGSRSDDSRRASTPYTFKLAFNQEWGVLLGGEYYVAAHDEGSARVRGVGDTTLVLKRAFLIDDATALGLELGVKAPTAKAGIGSGKRDYSVNGIVSRDFGALHLDANLNATRLGAYDAGTGRVQGGWSASFSMPLAEQWGATAELSGTRRDGTRNTAQLLLAAAYSPSKRLVFDFGAARGLTSASQDWSLFCGVVMPLARLW